ncbi:hypothetical protein T484DRAFT_2557228 [Baffinella frigidus]|nr:hypothetical protein T484DRAFT_2557228 [Cryptophyta sp. CCMP2293]
MKIGVATGGGERRHRDEWLRTGLAQEAVGWGCLSAALITLSVGTLVVYLGDWVLQDSFVAATCLVLGGREMSNAVGFGVAPVSRAEVTVHVFNTATPECCCPDSDGVERCAEWQAVALDSVTSLHTPGDKSTFIREYGHAGTFEPCWHSSAKDKVRPSSSPVTQYILSQILPWR